MPDLLAEVERFRAWAAALPPAERGGAWECDYEDWNSLYGATLAIVDERPFASWSSEELAAVLYAVARDNETEHLARELRDRGDDLLLNLAEACVRIGEPDARWQFATALGSVERDTGRRERTLKVLARDEHEYVRRRALQSLARTHSPDTEQYALEAWSRADESQEWARVMALWALHRVGSPRLEPLLEDAERDARPNLSRYAAKVRCGDVDP